MAFPENTINDIGIKHIWDKVTAALSSKVDKVSGKGLSTNDYTTTEKNKLAGIESGAQVNPTIDNTLSGTSTNAVQNKVVKSALDGKADNSDVTETDTPNSTPFLYRETPYEADRVFIDELVGGSVAWNQLVDITKLASNSQSGVTVTVNNDGTITVAINETLTANVNISLQPNGSSFYFKVPTGHKYAIADTSTIPSGVIYRNAYNGTNIGVNRVIEQPSNAYGYVFLALGVPVGTTAQTFTLRPQIFDLTQMFGTTIADYIYSLEQATEGSGIAWLKSHGFFTKDYYPYNAGELISVKTSGKKYVGFNQWDEEKLAGYYDASGNFVASNSNVCSKNIIDVMPNETYFLYDVQYPITASTHTQGRLCYYDANGNFLYLSDLLQLGNNEFTIPSGCYGIKFHVDGYLTSKYCINISKTEGTPKNGDYVPYEEHTYDISNIDLRGIPKLVNNELVYDGDTYESNGDVTRKYGTVDLGSLDYVYNNGIMVANLQNVKRVTGSEVPNAECEKYIVRSGADVSGKTYDKIFCTNNGYFFNVGESGIAIYDSSYTDATAFKTAMSGVYLIYELATPTTETTDPFTNPQICDKDGTEEFIDNRTVPVPVGHNSTYANLPSMMDGDFLNYMVDNFASKEYTDRAVERVAPKATLVDTWMISEEADTISVDLSSYDCNFFLLEYLFQSKRGTTLIPRPQGGSFSASVVTYNNGTPYYIELDYNPTTKELAYTSNVTSQFGILAIYTI